MRPSDSYSHFHAHAHGYEQPQYRVEHHVLSLLHPSSLAHFLSRAQQLHIDLSDPFQLWSATAIRTWDQLVTDDIGFYYFCVRCEDSPTREEWAAGHECMAGEGVRLGVEFLVPPYEKKRRQMDGFRGAGTGTGRRRARLGPGQDCADLAGALRLARLVWMDPSRPEEHRRMCEIFAKVLSVHALAVFLPYHPIFCPIDWRPFHEEGLIHPEIAHRYGRELGEKLRAPGRAITFPCERG